MRYNHGAVPSPPRNQLHSADATQEYRGPIDEIVTDVSMELLPDASVAGRPLPSLVKQAIARAQSLAPLAIDPAAAEAVRPPSPDASLFEFPLPVSPELFADATGELAPTDFDDTLPPLHEPPKWRFAAFATVMVAAGLILGLAVGGRTRVSEPPATDATLATTSKPIERTHVALPDPATVAKVAAPTEASAPTPIAAPAAPTTGTLLTPKWAKNRRLFVDGKELGLSGKLEAACGVHKVKVGIVGRTRKTTIPCGGEVTVLP